MLSFMCVCACVCVCVPAYVHVHALTSVTYATFLCNFSNSHAESLRAGQQVLFTLLGDA